MVNSSPDNQSLEDQMEQHLRTQNQNSQDYQLNLQFNSPNAEGEQSMNSDMPALQPLTIKTKSIFQISSKNTSGLKC